MYSCLSITFCPFSTSWRKPDLVVFPLIQLQHHNFLTLSRQLTSQWQLIVCCTLYSSSDDRKGHVYSQLKLGYHQHVVSIFHCPHFIKREWCVCLVFLIFHMHKLQILSGVNFLFCFNWVCLYQAGFNKKPSPEKYSCFTYSTWLFWKTLFKATVIELNFMHWKCILCNTARKCQFIINICSICITTHSYH